MFKRVMTGPKPEELVAEGVTVDDRWRKSSGGTTVRDLTTRDKLVAAPLIAAFVVLGFLPNLALNVINPAVAQTLHLTGVRDHQPSVASPEEQP
jgi:NADH-quinone oxidoreductase subunit M